MIDDVLKHRLTETEWIPTSSDILENDWEIYEEE